MNNGIGPLQKRKQALACAMTVSQSLKQKKKAKTENHWHMSKHAPMQPIMEINIIHFILGRVYFVEYI
ncbi:hypothetical protein NC652_035669 [Populus alba x Populus x berolinensis]|nr:hypothetical protein NC652_035669 [Populus alba x Populus x berolinensis]